MITPTFISPSVLSWHRLRAHSASRTPRRPAVTPSRPLPPPRHGHVAHMHPRASAAPSSAAAAPLTRDTLTHLQNGSDVRGVASALDASQPVTLTDAAVREIVASFVRQVSRRLGKPGHALRLAVGRDSRISGDALLSAAADGGLSEGACVTSFGLATTPAMFMATVLDGHQYDCAIMLTASHLPPNRNGLKFFTAAGSANKKDVREILSDAADAADARRGAGLPVADAGARAARLDAFDFLPVYSAHLVSLIRAGCAHPTHPDAPLRGFKVVVDAGNGAAGFFATQVLSQLGADVVGQFLEPDGMFPNHVPNPEDPKAMAMTVATVLREQADLGIVFDTDVDRSGVVDAGGLGINRNRLIALLGRIMLRDHPGTTIVTDSVTSNGLKRFIESLGGRHFRYRKGYKNVIDKGIELNEAGVDTQLAIETSGHGACMENYMLDDGAYLAVKIVIEMVRLRLSGDTRGIGGLLDGLDAPAEEREFRLPFVDEAGFTAYGARVVEAFVEFVRGVDGWTVEAENYEGYRVRVDEGDGREGWLLLRQSLHDPLLPLNVESEVEGGVARIVEVLVERFFPTFDNVDVGTLRECMSPQ